MRNTNTSFALAFLGLALLATQASGCTIITNTTPADDGGTSPPDDTGTLPPGTPTSIKIYGSKAAGDFKMSGTLALSEGKLVVTVAAIRDPESPTKQARADKVKFAVTAGASELSCTIGPVSSTSKASVDLAFINDTTGSMSGTVKGIAASVEKFATDVAAAGVDARFSMYTYGDAFATKSATDTTFKIGRGDFQPPSFDSVARPYVGLTDLTELKGFLAELKSSSVLGSGGGDGPENTIGCLDYANRMLTWRDGAARMFIAIGDNPSHQKGSSTAIVAPFEGPTGDELIRSLDGSAVIHVVGKDTGNTPYVNLKQLADKTGGAFLTLPSDGNVDLGALDLKSWLTSSFTGACTDPTGGRYDVVVTGTITGTSRTYVGTLTFDVELF